jgi:hypothetical protein
VEALRALPKLEALMLNSCILDEAAIAAIPRPLQRLDLCDCYGIDQQLVSAIAEMHNLRKLNLSMQLCGGAKKDPAVRCMRIGEGDLHERRNTSVDATKVLKSRHWKSLRLDGMLAQGVPTRSRINHCFENSG